MRNQYVFSAVWILVQNIKILARIAPLNNILVYCNTAI